MFKSCSVEGVRGAMMILEVKLREKILAQKK
jgi:hypothetical protein